MKIIGFNITGMNANKILEFSPKSTMNTNILFTNIQKEKIDFLKDTEALKTSFKFTIDYKDKDIKDKEQGIISYDGYLALSVSKDESNEFTKSWKKKEVPKEKVVPLYNFILRKCSVKALQVQEELGLPSHLPMPQIKPGVNDHSH